MVKYLLVSHSRVPGTKEQWGKYFQTLNHGNHLVGGSALGKGIGFKRGLIKNPKDKSIDGYMVITANNKAIIKKLAKLCPAHLNGGTVDIFPLIMD